ncbi:hypothetical protein N7539_008435 [Penicillium diatomitis]|uniref:Zn(2)-C6 fungal-type domain-containing protein n=1 Tax=Penicillium diatomitis TaxID=2819901 RepID=A0A9W9WTT9_9EURO|nr:uncharacterized protein N7539_008435 [Penicillium diatomitis]KAJ5475369.1 hypothetical protein N7539_008435 [Penicillium diatomitis]
MEISGSHSRRSNASNATEADVHRCERCKQRKTRCDREFPACQRCRRLDVRCEYAGRKRPGFPAGHRQLLEEKLRALAQSIV